MCCPHQWHMRGRVPTWQFPAVVASETDPVTFKFATGLAGMAPPSFAWFRSKYMSRFAIRFEMKLPP